jgi:hypothetical protein
MIFMRCTIHVFILYKNNGSHGTDSLGGENSKHSISGIMTLYSF